MYIIDIGHTAVMIPLAGTIAAWLVTNREWKLAFCWSFMFASGLSIVALSKIAFLGWGVEMQFMDFKALSGHAFRATVVLPTLFYVALQDTSIRWRRTGLLLGSVLSITVALLLIIFNFHTPSEVIITCFFGAIIDVVFIRFAKTLHRANDSPWAMPVSIITFIVIHSLKPSLINPRLVDVALFLSGREYPYQW